MVPASSLFWLALYFTLLTYSISHYPALVGKQKARVPDRKGKEELKGARLRQMPDRMLTDPRKWVKGRPAWKDSWRLSSTLAWEAPTPLTPSPTQKSMEKLTVKTQDRGCSSVERTCLAYMRLWVQFPEPHIKKSLTQGMIANTKNWGSW